jgi:S-adenosylmethionine:tRNA ribosyltransferase-isomerase
MNLAEITFERPQALAATAPPESRGLLRDEVRLMVSVPAGEGVQHHHAHFYDLPRFLDPGDLLVVNQSAVLPYSLPAKGEVGNFILNLSTSYGSNVWLAEPRWNAANPGPLPVKPGEHFSAAGLPAVFNAPYPGLARLWFVSIEGDLQSALQQHGTPIRYGYIQEPLAPSAYQTLFSRVPGSAEMPSAARPFTPDVVEKLQQRGVQIASVLLHTGVSSLEVETTRVEDAAMYPEPYAVPANTARQINAAHKLGNRVIAVGTTVVRALESAWDGEKVRASSGFTRLFIHPGRGVAAIDGLLTGMHDSMTSHLAMLYAVAGKEMIQDAYKEAIHAGYLWHEFGDSHLILRG